MSGVTNSFNRKNINKSSDGSDGEGSNNINRENREDSTFLCNICLNSAKGAVVSLCGHLFCYPCLCRWLEISSRRQVCPVCISAISKETVIHICGRGNTKPKDSKEKIPPGPAGQPTKPASESFSFSNSSMRFKTIDYKFLTKNESLVLNHKVIRGFLAINFVGFSTDATYSEKSELWGSYSLESNDIDFLGIGDWEESESEESEDPVKSEELE